MNNTITRSKLNGYIVDTGGFKIIYSITGSDTIGMFSYKSGMYRDVGFVLPRVA